MGDHPLAGIPPRYVTSHPCQLSLLPSVGWVMSIGQSVVMFCCWEVKAGWLIPFMVARVGGR